MIHAYALEPKLVAKWGNRTEFRFIHDKFGLGTPRALLEFPKFSRWKRQVFDASREAGLSDEDQKRVELLLRHFDECLSRRPHAPYSNERDWLENAEEEFARRPFAAILATQNPRSHAAVLLDEHLTSAEPRWAARVVATPARLSAELGAVLEKMILNCGQVHLVDPYFVGDSPTHREVLAAILRIANAREHAVERVHVHCRSNPNMPDFAGTVAGMARHLPEGMRVDVTRWEQRVGGEKLHNRYVLTDLGGVSFGIGLQTGRSGETDDIMLLSRDQFLLRWDQYVGPNPAFERIEPSSAVVGEHRIRR